MDDGVVVFEGINHSTMLKMLRPIYYSKIKTKKYDDALNDLAKAIKILGDKRNAVVHSQWFIDLEPETAMRVKIKKTSYENTKRKKIELGTDVEDEQTLIELINLLLLCNKTIKRLQYILEYEGEIVSK